MKPFEPIAGVDLTGHRVGVTGGGGFIGRRLVAGLLAHGAEVVALLRSGHAARDLENAGAKVAITGLRRKSAVAKALGGCDVLFNLAHDVRDTAARNLEAFDALMDAAAAAPVRRVVHFSSIVVYDDWPEGRIDENSPWGHGGGGDYRQAKIAMERRLLASAFEAAIVQPTIVYGRGSALWTTGPIRQLRAGGIVLPDPPGLCAAVHVDDVVQLALRAACLPDLKRERVIASGPDSPTWLEFYETYQGYIGEGSVILKPREQLRNEVGPPPAADAGLPLAARVSALLRRMVGHRRFEAMTAALRANRRAHGPAIPDPHLLALLCASPEISIGFARERFGYAPRYEFARGVAEIFSIRA